MMKKKVKKIPKYNGGGTISPDVLNKSMEGRFNVPTQFGKQQPMANIAQHSHATVGLSKDNSAAAGGSGFGGNWGAFNAAATAGGKMLMDAFGVEDNSQAGVTLNTSMQGAEIGGSIVPGWGHLIGGIAGGAIGAFKKGSVDVNTGEITSGGIFGRSMHSLRTEQNRIRNSIRAKTMTQGIQADYYNNPNVVVQPNVLVAEGGIMRQPVDALVSKGELIYNPITKKLSKVPGSKGKPNKADDVYARLSEGDVVISNSPTMIMANGKTPAQNLEGLIDSDKNMKAKEAIIKKVVNWQEANRTKPKEYAKFDEGTGEDGAKEKPIKKRRNSIWNRLQDKWNASAINDWLENYYNNIDKYEDHAIIDGRLFIKHNGKWYDSHKGGLGNALKGNTLPESGKGYMTDRYQMVPFKQGVYVDVDKSKIVRHKTNNTAVDNITKPSSNNDGPSNPELDFVSFRHTTPNYTVQELDIVSDKDNVTPNLPKKGTVSKPSSGKKTATSRATTSAAPQEEKLTPEQIAESLRIQDIGERHWLRGDLKGNAMSEPTRSLASLAKITPEKIKLQGVSNIAPLTGIKPLTDTTGTDSTGYTGSNWRDNLYRMSVLSQPLWDRAEAEPVNYESPVYKYMPTAIDISSQLRDVDQSYALARYNFANLYPNTGAGMAAGLQAASNRAKQLSNIRQYQTNAQNELIGKNVGIYNNWANEHARIMNEVYNKTAANRAAARNINRQNRAAALSNYGQMLKDDKQFAMDTMKLQMMEPMMQYGYENYDDYLKWKKTNGYG